MTENKFHKILHNADGIGDVSLVAFTIIDMMLAIVFFSSLAVDTATTIALVIFGIMASFGKIWSRIECEKLKKNIYQFIWLGFTIITFFGGIMFMLTTVQVGSDEPPKPSYLVRAEVEYTDAKNDLLRLQVEQKTYLDLNQRSNAATFDQRIADQNTLIEQKSQSVLTFEEKWQKDWKGASGKIKALSVFNRIPLILTQPSAAVIIALIFFSIAFATLEIVIYVMAGKIGAEFVPDGEPRKIGRPRGAKNKSKPEDQSESIQPTNVTPGQVRAFVNYSWQNVRDINSTKILSEYDFFKLIEKQNLIFDKGLYKYLIDKCKKFGIISDDGVVNSRDEEKIIIILC